MKTTRRTVLGWLLAAVLVRPSFDPAKGPDWGSVSWVYVPYFKEGHGACYYAEDEPIQIVEPKFGVRPIHVRGRCV